MTKYENIILFLLNTVFVAANLKRKVTKLVLFCALPTHLP